MKLSRIAAAVTTAALAPVVLIASPAFAADTETAAPRNSTAPTAPDQAGSDQPSSDQASSDQAEQDQAEQDRKTILAIIAAPMASAYMKEAGHKAMADGPAAMRKFIETDQHEIRLDDYRVAITRLLNDAGPVLKEGVGDLLSDSTATLEELRHFYEVTQHELRDQDNRVAIAQIIDAGGPEVSKAGRAALAGTAADRSEFLATGQYEARAKDEKAQQQDDGDSDGADDTGGDSDSADDTGSDSADDTGSDSRNDAGNGKQGTGNGSGTSTGNTAVAPQDSRPSLASTGAGDTALVAGGAGTALVAGAGILLAARRRRAASTS